MRQTKYNVDKNQNKREFNGIVFDSELEMKYYRDVVCPQIEEGEITSYELQKKYELQPKFEHNGKAVRPITYVADFYLEHKDGSIEVIDTKGFSTPEAELKRKMFWYLFPELDYKWMSYSKKYGGWLEFNELKKLRAQQKKMKKLKEKEEE